MTDLYHCISVTLSQEDRGKTSIQWQIRTEDADKWIAELRDRLGEPILESVTDAERIDWGLRQIHEHGAAVIIDRSAERAP